MGEINNSYGQVAGRIWETINFSGPLDETNIIKKTNLKKNDFYAGIGWLARENKILKNGNKYQLGDTNLTDKIGINAGRIWDLLTSQENINISNIAKITKIPIKDAYSALGWLARENKIDIYHENTKKQGLLFSLRR